MSTLFEYRVSNLAELLDSINNAVANSGRHASEILIDNGEWNCLGFALDVETLTDGSEVYNLRFGAPAPRAIDRIRAHHKAAKDWTPGSREYNRIVEAELSPRPATLYSKCTEILERHGR